MNSLANRKTVTSCVFVDPVTGSPLDPFIAIVTHLPGMDASVHMRQAFGTLARYQLMDCEAAYQLDNTLRVYLTIGAHGTVVIT